MYWIFSAREMDLWHLLLSHLSEMSNCFLFILGPLPVLLKFFSWLCSQELLMAVLGIIWGANDWTQFGYMQGKWSNHYTYYLFISMCKKLSMWPNIKKESFPLNKTYWFRGTVRTIFIDSPTFPTYGVSYLR